MWKSSLPQLMTMMTPRTISRNGDDQLQSFYHKDGGSGAVSLDQCDSSAQQVRLKVTAQHDNQRNEQRAVFTAGDS